MTACCHKRCALPVVEGTTRCAKHTNHHRAEVATKRVERRGAGRCGLCDREALPGKARCSKHDSSMGVYRCRRCGVLGHNRRTRFKATVAAVKAFLAKRPGALVAEVVAEVKHHYASDAGARARIVALIKLGVIDGVRTEKDGRAVRLYLDGAT